MGNTRCPNCGVKAKKEFTCRANLENVPMGETENCPPEWLDIFWTGKMICPKCKQVVLIHKEEK